MMIFIIMHRIPPCFRQETWIKTSGRTKPGMSEKCNFPEIKLARGMAILLVVLGSALPKQASISDGECIYFLHTLCGSFPMALFFILAGFAAYSSLLSKTRIRTQLTQYTHRLLIPYAVYSALTAALSFAFSDSADQKTDTGLLRKILLGEEFGGLWFPLTLFIVSVSFLLLTKRSRHPAFLLVCGGLLYVLYIFFPDLILSQVFQYSLFYAVGIWLREDYARAQRSLKSKKLILISLFFLLVMTLFSNITPLNYPITVLLGSMAVLGSAILLSKAPERKFSRFFGELGNYSYDIYLFNCFIQIAADRIFSAMPGTPEPVIVLATFVSGLAIPYLLSKYLIHRSVWLSRLFTGECN